MKVTKSQMEQKIAGLEQQLAAIRTLTGWRDGWTSKPMLVVPCNVPMELNSAAYDRCCEIAGEGQMVSEEGEGDDKVLTLRIVQEIGGTQYGIEYSYSGNSGVCSEVKGVAVPCVLA